jgi:hypothetical protein
MEGFQKTFPELYADSGNGTGNNSTCSSGNTVVSCV